MMQCVPGSSQLHGGALKDRDAYGMCGVFLLSRKQRQWGSSMAVSQWTKVKNACQAVQLGLRYCSASVGGCIYCTCIFRTSEGPVDHHLKTSNT